MALPLRSQSNTLGAMTIHATERAAFTEADLVTLTTIADQLGNAIENVRLVRRMARSQKEIERLLAEAQHRAAELATAKDAAESANRAKSDFLASMSHELRTPLNSILGYAQILKRQKNLLPAQHDGIDIIYKSGDHLLNLINDVLDLAKIEAQKFDLILLDFNLPSFLHSLVAIIRTRADQKDLGFVFEAVTALPNSIRTDEKRLRQVLLNLLGNAIKFTAHGEVVFRVGTVNAAGAYAPLLPGPATCRLRFEVQDTGVGLAPEAVGRLFRPFEQAGELKQRAEGTGLGLSISQKLVQALGGAIEVTSALGQGSKFWFDLDLPISEGEHEHPADELRPVVGYDGPARKVLVVDDREYNRIVLCNLLEPLGFVVAEAEDGPAALRQAQAFRPDLIFMDIVMPGMLGYEVTARLRQMPALKEVVIIAASASAFEADRQRVLAAGCNDFIAKPIEAHKLFALMARHLHLAWVYDSSPPASPATAKADPEALVPPPPERLAELHDCAMMGDMEGIQEQAKILEQLGPLYHPFAHKLRELAKNFESEAILALVERFLTQ
jgi:signal transduction histidine kinase/DNA-binding NarL/FixJ family response regulator